MTENYKDGKLQKKVRGPKAWIFESRSTLSLDTCYYRISSTDTQAPHSSVLTDTAAES